MKTAIAEKSSPNSNQTKSPQDACGFSPRKDYTDKPDDIEEVWLSFSWLKSLSEKISTPTPFVFGAGRSLDRDSTVCPEMELYTFTELSNGWISFKSAIFIILDRDIYNKKHTLFYIWYENGKVNSPKYSLKMPWMTRIDDRSTDDVWRNFCRLNIKFNNKFELLVKNEIVWYTTCLNEF